MTFMSTKIVIVGASSGIGRSMAEYFIGEGFVVGVAGRRLELLKALQNKYPDNVFVKELDVTSDDAGSRLLQLVDEMGGMDIYVNCAGIGHQNISLNQTVEMSTVATNCKGFTMMVTTAFNYFAERGKGHIAAITSISATKGLGATPAYSSTKRFQRNYLQSLAQNAKIRNLDIRLTEIQPGFVATDMLKESYPMLLKKERVAEKACKAIIRQKRLRIIDWKYSILVFFWRLIPRCLWEKIRVTNR